MAVAPYTLAQLRSAQGPDQVRAKFLAILGADPNPGATGPNLNHGFPVADWLSNPNGMELAYVNMVRSALYDLATAPMPARISSGWLAWATGDWLTFHASLFYQVARTDPTKTVFNAILSSTASAPPYDFNPGDVWLVGASGHRYVSTTGGHLTPGLGLIMSFEAEFAGAAANDNPVVQPPSLVTAFAGVTVSASVSDFADIVHGGKGTGHFVLARLSTGPLPGVYVLRVDVTGDGGVAMFSLSKDGGAFFSVGTLFPVGTLGTNNILVVTVNGSGTPTSFIAGDTYTTVSPGGTGYIQGNDAETDDSLRQRCRGRWPSISLNQTNDVFVLWAKLAVPSINRISVQADPLVAGRAQIVAADSHGGVDPTALAILLAFVQARLGDILSSVSVASAVNIVAEAVGTVTVTASTVQAVQQTIVTAWTAYLATIPIGGVVLLSKLEQIIMDAGAIDVQGLVLNGVATNLALSTNQVPIVSFDGGGILTDLQWTYV
jgi:hypothetical protein